MTIEDAIKENMKQIADRCEKLREIGLHVEQHDEYVIISDNEDIEQARIVFKLDWEGLHVLKGWKKNEVN